MDPMSGARRSMNIQSQAGAVIVPAGAPSLLPAALPSAGAQLTFFPPTAAFGMPPPFLGSPAPDLHLSGPYTRPLSGTLESCYPLLPYGMAIAKGSSPDAPEGGVVKKPRTVFTPKQLLYLEEEFLKNQFPNMEQRKKIAKALDLTQQHIQIWFQNRRAKKRRKKKRSQVEQQMKHTPKPPPFWPTNLPFSSNISEVIAKGAPEDEATGPSIVDSTMNTEKSNGPEANATDPLQTPLLESPSPSDTSTVQDLQTPSHPSASNGSMPRPSRLQCDSHKKGQGPTVHSPTQAVTPGKGHPQLPTAHPPLPTSTTDPATGNCMQSDFDGLVSDSSAALMSPSELGFPHPHPPPGSMLANSYDTNGHKNYTSAVSPTCGSTSLPSFHSITTQELTSSPCLPPPYSFGVLPSDTLTSTSPHAFSGSLYSSVCSTYTEGISPAAMSMMANSKSLPPDTPLSLPTGPSVMSPTMSPVTNSDCSLTATSPLTLDVPLVPTAISDDGGSLPSVPSTGQPDILGLQDESTPLIPNLAIPPEDISSPIHAAEPVTLADILGREWDLFSSSLRPVEQINPDTWTTESPQMLPSSNEPITSSSISKSQAMHSFSPYGMGYFPQLELGIVNTQQQMNYPVSGMSNGASHH